MTKYKDIEKTTRFLCPYCEKGEMVLKGSKFVCNNKNDRMSKENAFKYLRGRKEAGS